MSYSITYPVISEKITSVSGTFGIFYRPIPESVANFVSCSFEVTGKVASGTATINLLNEIGTTKATLNVTATTSTTYTTSATIFASSTDAGYKYYVSMAGSATGVSITSVNIVITYAGIAGLSLNKITPFILGTGTTLSTTQAPLAYPRYYTHDSKYGCFGYLHFSLVNITKDTYAYLSLQVDDGNWSNWTDVTTSTSIYGIIDVLGGFREVVIPNLVHGRHYRISAWTTASKDAIKITNAILYVGGPNATFLKAKNSLEKDIKAFSPDGTYYVSYNTTYNRMVLFKNDGNDSYSAVHHVELNDETSTDPGGADFTEDNRIYYGQELNSVLYEIINDQLVARNYFYDNYGTVVVATRVNYDGTVICVSRNLPYAYRYNPSTETWTNYYNFTSETLLRDMFISRDGNTIAYVGGNSNVKIYRWSGSAYVACTVNGVTSTYHDGIVVSDNGDWVFVLNDNTTVAYTGYVLDIFQRTGDTTYTNVNSTYLDSSLHRVVIPVTTGTPEFRGLYINRDNSMFIVGKRLFYLYNGKYYQSDLFVEGISNDLNYCSINGAIYKINELMKKITTVQLDLFSAPDIGTGLQGVGRKHIASYYDNSPIIDSYFIHDSDNSSNASKAVNVTDGNVDITNANVTGSNQQKSSVITSWVDDQDYIDVNVTNSTGTISGASILLGIATVEDPEITHHTSGSTFSGLGDIEIEFTSGSGISDFIEYNIEVSSGSTVLYNEYSYDSDNFVNVTSGSDINPFPVGDRIRYSITGIVQCGTLTYKLRSRLQRAKTWSAWSSNITIYVESNQTISISPIQSNELVISSHIVDHSTKVYISPFGIQSSENFGSLEISNENIVVNILTSGSLFNIFESPFIEFEAIDNWDRDLEFVVEVEDYYQNKYDVELTTQVAREYNDAYEEDFSHIVFKPNGLAIWGIDSWKDTRVSCRISYCTVSVAFDISYVSQSFTHYYVNTDNLFLIQFNNNGTRIFELMYDKTLLTRVMKVYDLSTAYSLGTSGSNFGVYEIENDYSISIDEFFFKIDDTGTILILGKDDSVADTIAFYRFRMVTPWDMSTMYLEYQDLYTYSELGITTSVVLRDMSDDGLYIYGFYQTLYLLIPWDIRTIYKKYTIPDRTSRQNASYKPGGGSIYTSENYVDTSSYVRTQYMQFDLYPGIMNDSIYTETSGSSPLSFKNLDNLSDSHPYTSGNRMRYQAFRNMSILCQNKRLRIGAIGDTETFYSDWFYFGFYVPDISVPSITSAENFPATLIVETDELVVLLPTTINSQEAFGSVDVDLYVGPSITVHTEEQTFYTCSPSIEFTGLEPPEFNQQGIDELEYIVRIGKTNFLDTGHAACYNSASTAISFGYSEFYQIAANSTGTRLVIGYSSAFMQDEELWYRIYIKVWNLSTAWDFSTYSEYRSYMYEWQSGYPSPTQSKSPFFISDDGLKITHNLSKYVLTQAWNFDTWPSSATQTFNFSGVENFDKVIYINSTGTVFILYETGGLLGKVTLSTAWDFSTATLVQTYDKLIDYLDYSINYFYMSQDGKSIFIDGLYGFYCLRLAISENLESIHSLIEIDTTGLPYLQRPFFINSAQSLFAYNYHPNTYYYLLWRSLGTAKNIVLFEQDSGLDHDLFINTEHETDLHPFNNDERISFMPVDYNRLLTSGSGYYFQVKGYVPDDVVSVWTTAVNFSIGTYWNLSPISIPSEEYVNDNDDFFVAKWNDQFIIGVTSGSSLEEFESPALSFPLMVNPQSIDSEEHFQINSIDTSESLGIVTFDLNIISEEIFEIPTVGNKSIAPTIVLNTASGNITTQTPYFEFTGSDTDGDELEYRIKLEYVPGEPYNIANKTLTQSWAFSGYFPQYIKPNGLSVWAIETTNVRKYDLSVANDFTTFGTVQTSSSGISGGRSIRFTDDGLRVFMINASYLYSWQLSVAWDLSTKYNQKSRYVQNGDYTARAIAVDPNGRYISVICYGGLNGYGGVQTITMSNTWDIESGSMAWSGGIQEPESGNYSSDGRYLSTDCYVFWLFGPTYRWVCWYFEIPFNYSTLVKLYEDGSSQDALIYSSDGAKIFRKASGNIYEYALQSENRSTWLDEYSSSSDDFVNTVNGGDTSPFTQAQKIRYTVPEEHKITSSGLFILTVFVRDMNGTEVWVQSGQRRFTSTVAAVISLSPLPSEEAFGIPTLIYDQDITPVPISSEEAFGTTSVGAQFLTPTSIVSQETFALAELFPFDERFTGSDYDPWSDSNWIVSVTP